MKKGKKVLSGLSIVGLILTVSLPMMADEKAAKSSAKETPGEKVGMSKGEKKTVWKSTAVKKTTVVKETTKELEKSKNAK
jgi:hypothetical protein